MVGINSPEIVDRFGGHLIYRQNRNKAKLTGTLMVWTINQYYV